MKMLVVDDWRCWPRVGDVNGPGIMPHGCIAAASNAYSAGLLSDALWDVGLLGIVRMDTLTCAVIVLRSHQVVC